MQVSAVDVNQGLLVAPSGVNATRQDVSGHNQAAVDDVSLKNDQISQMVGDMQNYIARMNISLQFSTYGEHGEKVAVTVADKETGEVIREIPSEEIRNLYAKMSEVAGIIFNEEV